jgi:hypothetical protein
MPSPRYQTYGLLETYHELGEYDFKIVLNPRFYKTGHDFRVEMFDSSNNPMKFKFEVWGRKVNVKFIIDKTTSDGVSWVNLIRGDHKLSRMTFWIIKP